MAPGAYWKGYLKLSLVSCPIILSPATSSAEKISFHRINKMNAEQDTSRARRVLLLLHFASRTAKVRQTPRLFGGW